MIKIFSLCLSVIFFSQLAKGNLPSLEEGVYVLNEKNFDSFINKQEFAVVFFYAPWCSHCTKMKPYYHDAANILKTKKTKIPVVLTKVDASVEKVLNQRFKIPGFPTLKIFRKGEVSPYDGPRGEGNDIVDYLNGLIDKDSQPSKVKILDKDNFSQFIKKTKVSMIYFYGKSCKLCEETNKEYEKAARIMSVFSETLAEPIELAKIEGDSSGLTKKYEVPGYPHFLLFKNGKHSVYKGTKNAKEITRFMKRSIIDGSREVLDFNRFYGKINRASEIYVLGFFNNKNDPLFKTYDTFAVKYVQEVETYHTFKVESIKYLKSDEAVAPCIVVYYHKDVVTEGPRFVVLKNVKNRFFSKNKITFLFLPNSKKQNAKLEEIESFVFKKAVPKLGFLSPQNRAVIYDHLRPMCYLIFNEDDVDKHSHMIYIRDAFHKIIKKYKDIHFVIANNTENMDFLKHLKIQDSDRETKLACFNNDKKGFAFGEFSDGFPVEDVEKFVKDFSENKLKDHLKSDPIPSKEINLMTVKTIVGKTISEFALTPSKEVVIAFISKKYKDITPQMFEALMNLVAHKYEMADIKNIIFGKIKIDSNDYPEIFKPDLDNHSLYFIRSYDKFPIKYTGIIGDDVTPMQNFIEKNLQESIEYLKKNPQKTKEKSKNSKETKETNAQVVRAKKPKKTCKEELCTETHEVHGATIKKVEEKIEL